jgi:predicted site-specific integrase-resolvase
LVKKKELQNQIDYLKELYPTYEIYTDIGSGINFKRPKFLKLIDLAIKNELEEIVIAYKDRLCRISFELIEYILTKLSNTKITIVNKEDISPDKEVTEDLIQIITVFSSKLYGLRKYTPQQLY